MIGFIVKLLLAIVLLAFAGAFLRSWQVENSAEQKIFAANSAPARLDGFYKGSVNLPVKVTWMGKNFNAASSTGTNIFEDATVGQRAAYPFTTTVGTHDSSTVLNISYDSAENPFWARPILDQIVETGPDHYLGKITLHVIPNYPLSLGFFRLQK
jgi:hypothetical protein